MIYHFVYRSYMCFPLFGFLRDVIVDDGKIKIDIPSLGFRTLLFRAYADVRKRIAQTMSRAGRLRHITQSQYVELNLRVRLYISGCCSVLTYGSEAWPLDERRCLMLNGVNAYMLFHITGHTRHEEELDHHIITFNLLWWIRARRMKWLDHILRLKNDRNGNERLVKQTVKRKAHSRTQVWGRLANGLGWQYILDWHADTGKKTETHDEPGRENAVNSSKKQKLGRIQHPTSPI